MSLFDDNNQIDYKNIKKYAVNGACYYSYLVLKNIGKYNTAYDQPDKKDFVLSVGVNGYKQGNETIHEVEIYYQDSTNITMPIFITKQSDLSLLTDKNKFKELIDLIELKILDPEELHKKEIDDEKRLKSVFAKLNQNMHDYHNIPVGKRIDIVASCIMAGLGVKTPDGEFKLNPLDPKELKSSDENDNTDGAIILRKVKSFLKYREIPEDKQNDIYTYLKLTLLDKNINQKAVNSSGNEDPHSPLYYTYKMVFEEMIPLYEITGKIDFTGTLFNEMNTWVDVPDGGENDVVLTPRYVTKLMAQLCEVNQDSYVWDWALGSGGFLISAMNLMIEDAYNKQKSSKEREEKILHIKSKQLLGIEKLQQVYILAVLNMILMDDGSSNIINGDSFKFDGHYPYNDDKDKEFPATVFLLNPPYSAEGNGMIFVKEAFKKMKAGGRGAVIIQDSAGNGKAKMINQEILKNNTLLASIKMPADLFKASVQTSIYLFETGRSHKQEDEVEFIDFREDGYSRSNRKKAKTNLVDSDNAKERYQELVKLITTRGNVELTYLKEGDTYFVDNIDPESGDDWNFESHIKYDITPTKEDFLEVVGDYLSFEVSNLLKDTYDL